MINQERDDGLTSFFLRKAALQIADKLCGGGSKRDSFLGEFKVIAPYRGCKLFSLRAGQFGQNAGEIASVYRLVERRGKHAIAVFPVWC